ncbi:MAG TPA: nucleotidyl transferase AbiEii/AbiGii toxin family protein [Candidatus Methylacidiphilales bacterium]
MLKPETQKVWDYLRHQKSLRGFVLLGGTALSLHIGHRLSEDLDFAYLEPSLPKDRLDILLRLAAEAGFRLDRNDSPDAVTEFERGGGDLHDYQQDFIANRTVKVTFFTLSPSMAAVLEPASEDEVRVASVNEIFKTKCLVSATRSKTRDWFDLYVLMKDHGYSLSDYRQAFIQAGIEDQSDLGLERLCNGAPQASDEGYEALLENPPTLVEMQDYFRMARSALEIEEARKAFAQDRNP